MQTSEELKITKDSLLVFMDETGHEILPEISRIMRSEAARYLVLTTIGWKRSGESCDALSTAIRTFPFMPRSLSAPRKTWLRCRSSSHCRRFFRFAVAATNKTNFVVDMHAMTPVMGMLKENIFRLVSSLPCSTVALIFESSERGDPLVRKYFGELELLENERSAPTQHCFMPKSAESRDWSLRISSRTLRGRGLAVIFRKNGVRPRLSGRLSPVSAAGLVFLLHWGSGWLT
jgi:hypothetical protein